MARKFSELRDRMSSEARARAKAITDEITAEMPLNELRRARTLTQETLAAAMDTTQGEVSKIEKRADIYVSTLRSYVVAMGGLLAPSAGAPVAGVATRRQDRVVEPGVLCQRN